MNKNALISVFNKENIVEIAKSLTNFGVNIYSTGGTAEHLIKNGIEIIQVEDLIDFPAILSGRVKTLHPKIFGGILNRRDNPKDQDECKKHGIANFDYVIVDLYPFEDTVNSGASESDIIEKIDIGGISLIRAAAKNFKDVCVVPAREYFKEFINILTLNNGTIPLDERKKFAARAFDISSHYDTHIFNYFNQESSSFKESRRSSSVLRYGENPHQKASFFGNLEDVFNKIQGKEISYNNLLDISSAIELMDDFENIKPTFAILKHNNACGIATSETVLESYKKALSSDPLSAFGGVLISNFEIDKETSVEISKLFCEVLIAPSFSSEALEILEKKKKLIILERKEYSPNKYQFKSLLNGVLYQDKDNTVDQVSEMKVVTKKEPSSIEEEDLVFASKVCKNTKSNTIVLAKDKMMFASGTGQTSRVDALVQAINKAKKYGFDLNGAVMASDAFFPFPDCIEIASKEGISAVIQPGGSIKDNLSIDCCNENRISMVFTGTRHFKH